MWAVKWGGGILFPKGLVNEIRAVNLEQLTGSLKTWDIENSLLKKGKFKAFVKTLHSSNIQLGFLSQSLPSLKRGTFPKGTILIFLFHKGQDGAVFLNQNLLKNEIMIVEEGQEIELITAQAMEVLSLAINRELFLVEFEAYFHKSLSSVVNAQKIRLKESAALELDSFLMTLLFNEQTAILLKKMKDDHAFIEEQILQKLFESIEFIQEEKKSKKFDARIIKKYIDENFQHNVKMSELAKELGISRRLLFSAFKEYYGHSPSKYLWSLRLNKAHELLTKTSENEKKVSEIAMECGFSHMSYFTREYKAMYKKLPSQSKK
jgi:AraC-like DNA-binding protein